MKDWQEIEGLYKKDNVYLAEAAQTLQRLAQYEIPALKKLIAKNDQAVSVSQVILSQISLLFRML